MRSTPRPNLTYITLGTRCEAALCISAELAVPHTEFSKFLYPRKPINLQDSFKFFRVVQILLQVLRNVSDMFLPFSLVVVLSKVGTIEVSS
jgi:hypothetical protein